MFAALVAPSIPAAAILEVARAFTPRFEQVGPLVLLDAGGLSRLFGNAQDLGTYLSEALAKHGTTGGTAPRVAIASTQTAAALLALGRPGLTVVAPGQEEKALAPLSVSVLDRYERIHTERRGGSLDPPRNRHLEILTKWGIRTLGTLAAIAGPDVFERLGDHGLQWQALARGIDARPLVPWVDEVPFEAALELEWPIEGLEPLSFVLARLFEPLSERLEQADRGAAVIHTSLRLTSKRVHARTLPLPSPMRDPKTLRTLVLLDLETHPPDAPIDTVRVCIEPTPGRVTQWTLLERAQPAPEQVSTLVARLSALMGDTHVGSPRLVDTWKPGAFEMTGFRVLECSSPPSRPEAATARSRRSSPDCSRAEADAEVPSALRRFRFPIPTRVQVQEGRPIRVTTDRHGFSSGAIVQSAGPWRTSGEWWADIGQVGQVGLVGQVGKSHTSHQPDQSDPPYQPQSWDRDEWDVAMADGTIYRLVVERGVGQWFLEGVVD